MNISETNEKRLLKLARNSIKSFFSKNPEFGQGTAKTPPEFKEKRGVFVTLHQKGQLRGCVGNLVPVRSLFKTVQQNAVQAAFHDTRFTPLQEEELQNINIEISILTPMQKVIYENPDDLIRKIHPDIDGVMIEKEAHCATFLPQVWEQLNNPHRFFEQLCLKAGLKEDVWLTDMLDVYTYQVHSFGEPE